MVIHFDELIWLHYNVFFSSLIFCVTFLPLSLSLSSSLAESVEVVYAEINVLKRENKQPEQRMREEEGSVYSTHMSFSVAEAHTEAHAEADI